MGRSDGQHLFEAFLNGRLNYLGGGGGGGGFMHMALTSKRETGFGAPLLLRSFKSGKVSENGALAPFFGRNHACASFCLVLFAMQNCRPARPLEFDTANAVPLRRAMTMESCGCGKRGRKRTCEERKAAFDQKAATASSSSRGWHVCKRNSNQKRRRLSKSSAEERLG